MKVGIAAAILLLFAGGATAADTTTSYWQAMDLNTSMVARQRAITTTRPSTADLDEALKGMAYIEGVADAFKAAKILCIPSTVSSGQLAAIVAKWLTNNPERWDGAASEAVFDALALTYRCRPASPVVQ